MPSIPKDYVIAKTIAGHWNFWNDEDNAWTVKLSAATTFDDHEEAHVFVMKRHLSQNGQCFIFQKDGDKLANNFYLAT